MLFTPLNHLAAHAGPPEPQDGGSNARRRLIRTGATMLLAGWLSGLPNPSGSTPSSQAPAANLQGQNSAPACAEGRPEYAFLAQRLKHHIRIEEEILYPAALVTAEYVRGLKAASATSIAGDAGLRRNHDW